MPEPYTIEEVDPDTDLRAWQTIIRMHTVTLPDDLVRLPDDGWWFIAYQGLVPVAYAGLTEFGTRSKATGKARFTKKTGLLTRSGVLNSHRGHGLQRDLIAARIAKAQTLKFTELRSTTYDNPHSSNNLIASGFRMFRPEAGTSWGCEGTNYWRLNLKEHTNARTE